MRLTHLVAALAFTFAPLSAQAAKPPTLCLDEARAGFVSLFDGNTLRGWQGATDGYAAEEGVLVCKKEGGGDLFTEKEYGDFMFRFEYKLEAGANNGVGIRAPLKGISGFVAMEIQILDDSFPAYKDWKPVRFNGSIYGAVAAKRGHLKPLGEWNAMEIKAKGSRITVTLNRTVILDVDMDMVGPKRIHDHDLIGLHRTKGYIAFCGHGHRLEFRNIRIKENG